MPNDKYHYQNLNFRLNNLKHYFNNNYPLILINIKNRNKIKSKF